MHGKAQEQFAQRNCAFLIPEIVQDQVGWDLRNLSLVGGILLPIVERQELDDLSLTKQAILWFYDSMSVKYKAQMWKIVYKNV